MYSYTHTHIFTLIFTVTISGYPEEFQNSVSLKMANKILLYIVAFF